jgi:glycerol kinase
MEQYVLALDQGTTSTRAIVFDRSARLVAVSQRTHAQHYPAPGRVEQDPIEIWRNARRTIQAAAGEAGIEARQIVGLGIANQRETTVVWDRRTGRPVHRAISWQDVRTAELIDQLARDPRTTETETICGLPLTTYFAAPRLRWLLDHVAHARERAEAGELLFGTMETWLIWNLTGGPNGGTHVSDVTNASRTMLMDIRTQRWDPRLTDYFDIPERMLPRIEPSLQVYGTAGTTLPGVPIAAALGDQQAALFGQACFEAGEAKCTYGTGSFLLMNTGAELVRPSHGLISTVAYQIAGAPARYALEGSIAVSGSLVQWFRDSLGIISCAPEIETLARTVDDNGGCYIVPAFSGLLAPYWRGEARGTIVGLTSYVTKAHLARAALEATAWQTREVIDAMNADARLELTTLKVDGGMTSDNLLLQMVADVVNTTVVRPMVTETVSVGAAYAAGLSVGWWPDFDALRRHWHRAGQWTPTMSAAVRDREYENWKRAVERSFNWIRPASP